MPIIGLTGGEPFFYKNKQQGITYNIYDLVDAIHNIILTSQIIIKKSGWGKRAYLDDSINGMHEIHSQIDIRFGFN